ncbi:hypothetical protein H4R22_004318 [Coemansia sp. RSA 1290]|nr:hypothetical protein H4R22_004318 [Coemansia sp. RSA 1290]
MKLNDILQAIGLAVYSRNAVGNEANNNSLTCQGSNGTIASQCLRLYGGQAYHSLPECIPKSELSISSCLSSPGAAELQIPPCDTSMFESEFPQKYLDCISSHSGIVYPVECNTCQCMCNGLSTCTKRGCVV